MLFFVSSPKFLGMALNMYFNRCFLLALCLFVSVGVAQKISLFDELAPLYPDTEIGQEVTAMTLHAPRGGVLGVNLLLKSEGNHDILKLKHNFGTLFEEVATYQLIDVPVEENTGLDSRTEQYKGDRNPHVIRSAPFTVYEVLKPTAFLLFVDTRNTAFHLSWKIPTNLPAGTYHNNIVLQGKGFYKVLSIKTVVHQTRVPPASYRTYKYTNWFSLSKIAEHHGVEQWSDSFWVLVKKYAELMAKGRQNVFWMTTRDMFEMIDGRPVLQKARARKIAQIFSDAGIAYIEFAPIAHRTDGDWSVGTLSANLKSDMLVNSKEGRAFFKDYFTQLKDFVDESGWYGRCLFHLCDEPTDELVKDYRRFTKHFRKYFPHAPLLEATMTIGLSGAVDNWCPQVQEYQKHRDFFEKRKQAGDKVWVYTCLVPGGKWLNRLLDQHHLRQVYLGWSLAKFNLEGFLHWGLNHYNTDNPFTQSVVDHPAVPNTNNKLPAGDSHVFYPGINAPWAGLRFNAHRIGMEDAELFRRLAPTKRDELMQSCFRSFDEYEESVKQYRLVKKQLLTYLDTL